MPRDMRRPWDDSCTQNAGEHLVPAREVTVTQTTNEFGARKAERTGAGINELRDRVPILVISR